MKFKRVDFKYKTKNFSLDFVECNFLKRISGLTFTKKSNAKALLFDFKKPVLVPIHSLFVFFDFIAVWLDEKGKVVDLKVVHPWNFSVCPTRKFNKLLEIPINNSYFKFCDSLVGHSSKGKRFK
jgi:uncharacterized membrane protein (UPF0127 family)